MLGSDVWQNGSRYNGVFAARLAYMQQQLPDDRLASFASTLRQSRHCDVSPAFSAGDFNLVKRLTFDDDESWVLRVRMPPIEEFRGGDAPTIGSRADLRARAVDQLRSEIATMEYIR